MTDQPHTQSTATIQRILEERARALARPPAAEATGNWVELLILALGAERYGVEIHSLQEIRPLSGLTPVPGAPPIWAGVVNLRGHLYPVLNLRGYLMLPEAEAVVSGKVVLVAAAGLEVGLLADEVLEVRRVPQAEIAPPLAEAPGARREVVRGITSDLLVVLDLEALLADPRLVVQEDVT